MTKDRCLEALEVYRWVRKENPAIKQQSTTPLAVRVANCTACELATTRTQTVLGVGNLQARLMIIGEAPGFYEDQQGEPFVGRAGALLTNMLKAFGLTRSDVYIANILKCRPPNNRDPRKEEVASCTPFLLEQINTIQPKLLLALGRIAAHYLLETSISLEKLRGIKHVHASTATPLYVTYHPAYLLRSPGDKRKAYLDWVTAMSQVD
jgi:uracil-DNA glycosylase